MKVFIRLRSNFDTGLLWVKNYSITIACLALFSLASIIVLWPKITVQVPAGYLGVIFKPLGGGVIEDQIANEGINIKWPWTIITNYSVQIQKHSIDLEVLTADLMKTKVKVTFQYEANPATLPILHKYVGEKYLESIVVPEVISVTRGLIAGFKSDQAYTSNILSLQNAISIDINKLILEKISPPGLSDIRLIQISDVQIIDIQFPEDVEKAIQQKLVELAKADGYKYILEAAKQEAKRKAIEAEGIRQFQETVKTGLTDNYLRWKGIEATEKLANSDNTKVVVFGQGAGGLPLIFGDMDKSRSSSSNSGASKN
jgi:regulator of protease activity HflC (stomatin/prohibitin superfamily)